MYGSELEDDEDEVEEELRAQEAARSLDSSTQELEPVPGQPRPSQSRAQKESQESNLIKESSNGASKPTISGDEAGELTPMDSQRTSSPSDKTA